MSSTLSAPAAGPRALGTARQGGGDRKATKPGGLGGRRALRTMAGPRVLGYAPRVTKPAPNRPRGQPPARRTQPGLGPPRRFRPLRPRGRRRGAPQVSGAAPSPAPCTWMCGARGWRRLRGDAGTAGERSPHCSGAALRPPPRHAVHPPPGAHRPPLSPPAPRPPPHAPPRPHPISHKIGFSSQDPPPLLPRFPITRSPRLSPSQLLLPPQLGSRTPGSSSSQPSNTLSFCSSGAQV